MLRLPDGAGPGWRGSSEDGKRLRLYTTPVQKPLKSCFTTSFNDKAIDELFAQPLQTRSPLPSIGQ